MSRLLRFCLLALALLAPALPVLAANEPASVEILAVTTTPPAKDEQRPLVTVNFRVKDATGRDLTAIELQNLTLSEGNQPVDASEIVFDALPVVADATRPTLPITLSNGKTDTLITVGATIGVVYDKFDREPAGNDPLRKGSLVVQSFLDRSITTTPSSTEDVRLFLVDHVQKKVVTSPEDNSFETELYRNTIVTAINTSIAITSEVTPTYDADLLYSTITQAITETVAHAVQRGSFAVVALVSDGSFQGNAADQKAIDERLAADRLTLDGLLKGEQFQLIAFDVSAQPVSAEAEPAVVVVPVPTVEGTLVLTDVERAFADYVKIAPAAVHTLSYPTRLYDDRPDHTQSLTISVQLADGSLAEGSAPIDLTPALPKVTIPSLTEILLFDYLLLAVPVAIVLSGLLVLTTRVMRLTASLRNFTTRKK